MSEILIGVSVEAEFVGSTILLSAEMFLACPCILLRHPTALFFHAYRSPEGPDFVWVVCQFPPALGAFWAPHSPVVH